MDAKHLMNSTASDRLAKLALYNPV